jgi:hypothetical protein
MCQAGTGGYMVWYGSAENGFRYEKDADARGSKVNWQCNSSAKNQINHKSHHHHN